MKLKGNNYIKYIPLDKSWLTRIGVLDIIHGYSDIEYFLDKQADLNEDLAALKQASKAWKRNAPVNVGESATLYRLLQFASWKLNLNKVFIKKGTLQERKITNNPDIVNFTLQELLKLDNGTTQWATASVILGNVQRISNPPNKLQQTYEAVDHWKKQRKSGLLWEPKNGETIQKQAETFLKLKGGEKPVFAPTCSDDYCFARVFGYIAPTEGQKRWPSLRGHESDRIKEMENTINKAKSGRAMDSKDHRVIQAIAMWATVKNKKLKFLYPECVNKSWPRFWDFLVSVK